MKKQLISIANGLYCHEVLISPISNASKALVVPQPKQDNPVNVLIRQGVSICQLKRLRLMINNKYDIKIIPITRS